MASAPLFLLADVGGTNTRCAIAPPGGIPARECSFPNAEFAGLAPLLARYLGGLDGKRPTIALLAIAAPLLGERVSMTNLAWEIDADELAVQLGLERVRLVNDFVAQAWALPVLKPGESLAVGGGRPRPGFPMVVLGPGTGLGVAALLPLPNGKGHIAIATEGGHVTMPAVDETEARLVAAARQTYGHCSAERLLSGPGLAFTHHWLHGGPPLQAPEVAARADRSDEKAVASLELLFTMLGTVAGNLALTYGALGGIWIAGGIVPQHARRFADSGFRARFEDKGRYRDYLAAIPTRLVLAGNPALRGLAAGAAEIVRQ